MDVEFYQMLFLHLLRWSCGFCLFFCWCGVSHWLIWVCWTILVILGWIQLDCGVWSFLCVVGFGLLIFFKLIFYWSIVDLCYVNFCCTANWLSYTHIYILFHCDLSQDIEYSFLCYTVGPCCFSILYVIVCIY